MITAGGVKPTGANGTIADTVVLRAPHSSIEQPRCLSQPVEIRGSSADSNVGGDPWFNSIRNYPFGENMISRPESIGAFEYAVTCGLRAAQLSRGCTPRVPDSAGRKTAVTAQLEVSSLRVVRVADLPYDILSSHDSEARLAQLGKSERIHSELVEVMDEVGST